MLHYTPRPRPLPSQARPSQAPGRVPVFHIAAPPRVRRWLRWCRWHGLRAWLALPSPSRWLLRTIRLGYAIQFARRPPKFRGIRFTSVKPADAPVLRAEIAVLLAKDAIEPVPPADMRSGLFSPYFIVPKKGGGLRPILDLRVLNRALHKLPFKMLTQKRIFGCVRPLDWFAAIDLKDAYFHVSILPRHRPFLHFAFEGQAYQYKVLPFGLSLSPRVFTKVVEAALVPLREQGVRILNYLDDWLILAQSRKQLSAHRDLVLKHLSLLGLRVNWEKSKLVPTQRISFLGMEFDSVNQTARLTQERAQSVLNCFKTLSGRTAVPLKLFQRLLGHMAAAAVTVPLGLLHMRPLQHWLYGRIPRWAWKRGTYRVQITPACRKTFRPVVRSLVPSGRSAPGAGIQACCGIHRCLDHRLGSHVQRARSIRGLDGSPTALAYQLPRVASSTPCPEPSQRAASAQGRSGPYGQHCDRCVYQPARRFALPSHVATRPPPPPLESEASEVPSCHPHPRSVQSGSRRAVSSSTSRRVETPSPGGSADLGTVRSCSGRPVCISRNHPLPKVLLPNRGNARHGCTGTQLAPGPAQICVPPSEPTSTDTVQDQGGRGAGLVSGSILAQQDLVPGTHAPRDSPSLANSSEEGSAFSETGHPMAPVPGPVETPRMVPGWDAEVLADLPQEVALTITSARAPSTRRAYTLKWNLFVEWCCSHQEDPRRCSIRAVLSFLQQGLERRLSPSTLKVYVAAISAYHDPVEGKSVGKHNLVVRFLRGARRLNPPRPPLYPLGIWLWC